MKRVNKPPLQHSKGYSTNSTGDLVSCSRALVSTKDDIWKLRLISVYTNGITGSQQIRFQVDINQKIKRANQYISNEFVEMGSFSWNTRTFGSFKAVELDWLDVDDQVGHFLCGERLTPSCTLRKHKRVKIRNTIQSCMLIMSYKQYLDEARLVSWSVH